MKSDQRIKLEIKEWLQKVHVLHLCSFFVIFAITFPLSQQRSTISFKDTKQGLINNFEIPKQGNSLYF